MDAPVTLVWMAPEPPDAEQSRALSSWARARAVTLAIPRDEHPPMVAVDGHVADDVEALLDHARDAIAARDAEAAARALDTAESALRAHPELPQAAWLMAEVQRARSTRWRRVPPTDAEAADRAWMEAEALDGGRVPGLGEAPAATRFLDATVTLEVSPHGAGVWVDGAVVRAQPVTTRVGTHAVVVLWERAPVWAEWVDVPAGSSAVHIAAPEPPPCSSSDVARARLSKEGLDVASVRCRRWAAALAGSRGGSVLVAVCEENRCGPLLEWTIAPTFLAPLPPERDRGGWPAWASWALVGTGAAIAAGVAIGVSGALQPAPTETRFVSGGVKAQ